MAANFPPAEQAIKRALQASGHGMEHIEQTELRYAQVYALLAIAEELSKTRVARSDQ